MLVMRFADVQWPGPLSLHSMYKAQYKCQVIIIIIMNTPGEGMKVQATDYHSKLSVGKKCKEGTFEI